MVRRLTPGDDDILRALETAYERPIPAGFVLTGDDNEAAMGLYASAGASRDADQVLWTWAR